MPFLVGTDIVLISKIKTLKADALEKIFHPSELSDNRAEHLAGILAAKEAFFKALGQPPKWQQVEVKTYPSGQPQLLFSEEINFNQNRKVALSISHDGDYAIATVIIH
jgi:phosphopantetheine--protein transferase-like protein